MTLEEQLSRLPEGATITRRKYSWAVELPDTLGYKSCGVTIADALDHALSGQVEKSLTHLKALAGVQ